MVEVCFGDSVKGALKIAQSFDKKTVNYSAFVAVFGDNKDKPLPFLKRQILLHKVKKKQRELNEQAIHLESKRDDLVGIFPDLSLGDISAEDKRRDFISMWFEAASCGSNSKETRAEAEEFWQTCISDLEKLKDRAYDGEAIRIWADGTPDGMCGFLFVCDLLKDYDCPVTVVKLPEEVKRADNVTVRYRLWGEVEPQLFGRFAEEYSVSLSKEAVRECAEEWRTLQKENSPLRAVKDGKVISVGEDYYDGIIRSEFPEKSCRAAEIIGNVLGRHQLAVSDFLIAERIREFIKGGELRIIEENAEHFYGTIVEKT